MKSFYLHLDDWVILLLVLMYQHFFLVSMDLG